jgi:peptidoglycan/LPS O-acetylase OafA/YrhL
VIFHAFPGRLNGGFVGVDIFFVISGFLISSIILENLNNNTFSFRTFYGRRIRRIFPALSIVLIASLAFGWFELLPGEYKQLGKHIAGGASFISNFLLWGESGYFDNPDTKPLLHLWSLGIEEQFYIIWPLILFVMFKLRLNLLTVIAVVALSSFVLNIEMTARDTVAAFYSPQTRFWELLVGSSLAYLSLHKTHFLPKPDTDAAHLLSFGGVGLIAVAALMIHEDSFPGWWAVLPTIATAAIIFAGPQVWLNRELLSNRVLVWIGLISFPLYLWHWPLLSFANIVEGEIPNRTTRIDAVLASIGLAWLTYWLVETRVRKGSYMAAKCLILCALMLAVGYAGYASDTFNGFKSRLGERANYYDFFDNTLPELRYQTRMNLAEKTRDDCNFFNTQASYKGRATHFPLPKINDTCFTRNQAYKKAVFIWGDSHAMHLNYGLTRNLPSFWQVLQVASSGCAPRVDIIADPYCDRSNSFAIQAIKDSKPDVVVVAQNQEHDIGRLDAIATEVQRLGVKKLVIAGPTPHWKAALPSIVVRNFFEKTPRRTYVGTDMAVIAKNQVLRGHFKLTDQVVFADLIGTFCNEDGCLVYIGNDERNGITSYDRGHLTPAASDYLAKSLLVPLIVGNATVVGSLGDSQ